MKKCDECTLSRAEELFLVGKALLIGNEFVNAELEFLSEVLPNSEFSSKNTTEAFKYFKRAAELGNAEAKIILGRCLQMGRGTERNYKEAIKWLKEPAEQGSSVAQTMIGVMYLHGGYEIEKNADESVKWLKLAVENGNQHAKSILDEYFGKKD